MIKKMKTFEMDFVRLHESNGMETRIATHEYEGVEYEIPVEANGCDHKLSVWEKIGEWIHENLPLIHILPYHGWFCYCLDRSCGYDCMNCLRKWKSNIIQKIGVAGYKAELLAWKKTLDSNMAKS